MIHRNFQIAVLLFVFISVAASYFLANSGNNQLLQNELTKKTTAKSAGIALGNNPLHDKLVKPKTHKSNTPNKQAIKNKGKKSPKKPVKKVQKKTTKKVVKKPVKKVTTDKKATSKTTVITTTPKEEVTDVTEATKVTDGGEGDDGGEDEKKGDDGVDKGEERE